MLLGFRGFGSSLAFASLDAFHSAAGYDLNAPYTLSKAFLLLASTASILSFQASPNHSLRLGTFPSRTSCAQSYDSNSTQLFQDFFWASKTCLSLFVHGFHHLSQSPLFRDREDCIANNICNGGENGTLQRHNGRAGRKRKQA